MTTPTAGGSEKFQDKQNYFYQEVKKLYSKQNRSDQKVVVMRSNLLESVSVPLQAMHDMLTSVPQAMAATKGFGTSDWCKKFVVEFVAEEGEAMVWGPLTWGSMISPLWVCVHVCRQRLWWGQQGVL